VDAITGRYKNATSRDAVYSILQESYPDMSSFNASFNRIDSVVSNSRRAFTQMQSNLLRELNAFEQWRTGSFVARVLMKDKFPDHYDFINERHWMPGDGKIKWSGLITRLEEINYNGAFMYEVSLNRENSRILTSDIFRKNHMNIKNFGGGWAEI
jgi:hypothetical protein